MAAALRALSPFPSFPSHPSSSPPRCPSTTEVRFSRWNNANAESFVRRERLQQEIEDDLRRHRRYDSANRLADIPPDLDDLPFSATEFRSHGTPSSPSAPSIPGRASKYSKPPLRPRTRVRNPRSSDLSHPAFRPMQTRKFTRRPVTDGESAVSVGEHGISYKFEDAPFEFQYSYTETPKVKPLALREPPYLPFGPDTMPRPWTGRAPLPASKKKLPEFDSFRPPPPGKKGVKPVQSPGPFLAGSGPKYVLSREEILGEMLTEEEVNDLVKGCMKTTRQLNMGRDGLTHNMLDNMHAHWKRRRVCKIKCKGVCTVDMDNVRQQLEEKTGGKVIYNRGGVIFLFRGRNYNYKTRPRFPLMLWKPTPPVYPKLIQRVPEGLTVDEATELRKRGRELLPICKLGKNGVYINLVKDVKEAFEECELVRINCQGLHKSDCRKIGAKLKDLVPCVLLSFEYEHILMWRGKDWKSSLPPPEDKFVNVVESASDSGAINSVNLIDPLPMQQLRLLDIDTVENSDILVYDKMDGRSSRIMEDIMDENEEDFEDGLFKNQLESAPFESSKLIENTEGGEQECRSMSKNKQNSAFTAGSNLMNGDAFGLLSDSHEISDSDKRISDTFYLEISSQSIFLDEVDGGSELTNFSKPEISLQLSEDEVSDPCILHESVPAHVLDNKQMTETMSTADLRYESTISSNPSLDGVILLLKQAIENGSAIVLDNNSLDANDVYQRAVELAKTAPPGPVFRQRIPKATNQKIENTKGEEHSNQELVVESAPPKEAKRGEEKASWNQRKDNLRESFPDVVPHGSLRVDELAKLLA